MMMQDHELLRAYWRDGSEPAFAELVKRHVDMVFSTARRQVRDAALAEDVSQRVFCLLARKAPSVSGAPTIAGWLYRATRFCAAKTTRSEMRRRKREQEAIVMNFPDAKPDDVWEQLSPILDDALATLNEKDRLALLLRFFQGKPMREVGEALGITEGAAKMRVARSIERLREFFARRGVACSVASLTVVLTDRSVEAAPANLARLLAKAALSGAAGVSGLSLMQTAALLARLNFKALMVFGSTAILCAAVAWHVFDASDQPRSRASVSEQVKSPAGTAAAPPSRPQLIRTSASHPQKDLTDVIANLRAALHSTNDSVVPGAAVVEAVYRFGSQLPAAFPILKEEAGAHDKTRPATDPEELAPRRAVRAMGFLGKSVSEATPWLWNLYDEEPNTKSDTVAYLALSALEQIGFQAEDIGRLAEKVLARMGPPRPDLPNQSEATKDAEARDVTGNAFVKGQASGWIAKIIQENPPAATPFLPALESLLTNSDEDVRFWAACALLQSEGMQNPAIAGEISAGLKKGSQARIAWASQLLQGLGDAAQSIVPALLEAANASGGNTREWAFLCAGTVQSGLRAQNPEVDQSMAKEETNHALVDKLNSQHYTANDLIELLQRPGSATAAANLLVEKFPLASGKILPALCAAVPRQQDEESRDAVLSSIRKLDPTEALAPEDAKSIVTSLYNFQYTSEGKEAFIRLLNEGHLLEMSWGTRPGFQTFATNLAIQNPVAFNTFVTAVLAKAPSWRNLLPPMSDR
jgi:RNA polymerase sigma factor (sigma-70 family)